MTQITQVPEAPAEAPARPRRERDPLLDNAKFLAILLVVAGHGIEALRDVPAVRALYLFLYMFHMPLFIVITGYLSRGFGASRDRTRKLVVTLVVPYLIFETAYTLLTWAMTDRPLELSLLDPHYLTWFLISLLIWRLSTPVWQRIRYPMAAAVVVSLLSFTAPLGAMLDLHRALGLLPFYVLGLSLRPEHFALLRNRWARVLGAPTLLAGLAVAFVAGPHMAMEWVFWRSDHGVLGVNNLTGTAMRLALMLAAITLVAAFLTVVPARRTWFTALGAATLYAYLLHGFGFRVLKFTGWDDADWLHTVPGAAVMFAGGVLFAALLCSAPVRRLTGWAVEPRVNWLFAPARRD